MASGHDKLQAYVYLHKNPQNGEVFYVGVSNNNNKGKHNRANRIYSRSVYWNNCVKKHGFDVEIYKDYISWDEACDTEKELILKYGRRDLGTGILVNLTEGGEGVINRDKKSREYQAKKTKESWASGKMDSINKPIYQYSDNGDLVKSYKSQSDAERLTGICKTEISACIRGKRNRAGGFYWSYSDNIKSVPPRNPIGVNNKISIIGYAINSDIIYNFDSSMDAERAFGIIGLSTSISKCIHGCLIQSNDILWYKKEHNKENALKVLDELRGDRFVIRIDKNNNIDIFASLKEACLKTIGIDKRNVSACMFNKQNTAYGYKWMKLKDYRNAIKS